MGPYVLEFNARFGDPETQVVLPRLESDLLELCAAVADGRLDPCPPPRWTTEAACGVVMASVAIPARTRKAYQITGLDTLDPTSSRSTLGRPRAGWAARDDRRACADAGRAWSECRRGARPCLCQHRARTLPGRALAQRYRRARTLRWK